MFILTKDDNTTPTIDNPVFVELDSTSTNPDPSEWIRLGLSLPAGYESRFAIDLSGGVTINFEGTYANVWDISSTLPVAGQAKNSEIRVEILDGLKTFFWVRAFTSFNETPIDDRSTAVKVDGEIKKV